jgi:hypothetical protein
MDWKKKLGAATVAFGAVLMTAGVAHADDEIMYDGATGIPWSWDNEGECQSMGPVMTLNDAAHEAYLDHWYCEQHDDGNWYLHRTNNP